MKNFLVSFVILSTYYASSAHGQPQQQQQQRTPVNYEYVYYDYYDDYYYDQPAPSGQTTTNQRQPQQTRPRAPSAPLAVETQQQKPLQDEEDPELPDYDIKEIVAAWKEFVKDKEKQKKKKQAAAAAAAAEESFDYDLTGPRGTGPRGGQRFQGTGIRGGGGTGFRGTGVRGTGFRGTGPRGTGVRGGFRRGNTGVRGGGGGTGLRNGGGFRGTGQRVSGPRATGFRATAGRGTGLRGTGGRRPAPPIEYDYDYPQSTQEFASNTGSNNRFVADLLTGIRGGGGGGLGGGNRFVDPGYECEPLEESYSTPDKEQCDKYYECNIKGEEKMKLCDDGLVYDIASQHCDYPAKVNCTGRPDLQEAQVSKNCPRANGFFPFPAEESCQKFWDCRGGKSYLQECPVGVIFDPKVDACVTPDQSARPECAAGKFLGFECPSYEKDEVLRFGNHDRLPSPKNCQEFFTCLRTGQPRLGVCPKKTVFNSESGNCDKPENVKGCESYWKEKEAEELADYYDY